MATLAIAIVQVGGHRRRRPCRPARRRLAEQVERDVKPLFGHLNAIGRDAARAAALATAQVERADQLFTDVALRIEQTVNTVQATIIGPVREGRALLSAFRAAMQAMRELAPERPAAPGPRAKTKTRCSSSVIAPAAPGRW